MMKAIYDSTMKEKMGESLQLNSQDELIDKDNSFRPRLKQRRTLQKQKTVVSTSDDEQFYEATDSMSQPRCNSDYVKNVNQLNENFSERINLINRSNEDNAISRNEASDVQEINTNKKRVLLFQKSRDDSGSD
jgi:hypothetical protein